MHARKNNKAKANILIGNTLKTLRERNGLTQTDVAKKLQTSQVFVSNIERGRRGIRLTEAILYSFGIGITPQELYEELKRALLDNGFI